MVYIALAMILVLVGIDQGIKLWAFNVLANADMPIQFIKFGDKEIINLSYCENTGAAFSIFKDQLLFLIIITSVFIFLGIYLIASKRIKEPILVISLSLIIAGGIGNLIDRIFRRFVIDYIEIKLFRFAVFNFADCCVVIGAIILAVAYILLENKKINKDESV